MKTQHNDGEDNHVQIAPLTVFALEVVDRNGRQNASRDKQTAAK
jgi:hypothetical protein